MYCQILFELLFVHSLRARVYHNWCLFTNAIKNKYTIHNLLVNVNNNSITIEFLKMILSFSDVILANLSFPCLIFFDSLPDIYFYSTRVDEIRKWKIFEYLLKKSKILRGILWDFLRNSIWFGSFSHEKSQKFFCWAGDINLVSWIKMKFMENVFPFSYFSFFFSSFFTQALFYWNTFLSF